MLVGAAELHVAAVEGDVVRDLMKLPIEAAPRNNRLAVGQGLVERRRGNPLAGLHDRSSELLRGADHGRVVGAVAGQVALGPVGIADEVGVGVAPVHVAEDVPVGRPAIDRHDIEDAVLADGDPLVLERHLQGGGLAAETVGLMLIRDVQDAPARLGREGDLRECAQRCLQGRDAQGKRRGKKNAGPDCYLQRGITLPFSEGHVQTQPG